MLIGELAKKADVTKDTIRHYESLGLLLTRERPAGQRMYRDYSEENLGRIKMIQVAKAMGIKLSMLQAMANDFDNGHLSEAQIIQFLERQLADVRERIQALQQAEALLLAKLEQHGNSK